MDWSAGWAASPSHCLQWIGPTVHRPLADSVAVAPGHVEETSADLVADSGGGHLRRPPLDAAGEAVEQRWTEGEDRGGHVVTRRRATPATPLATPALRVTAVRGCRCAVATSPCAVITDASAAQRLCIVRPTDCLSASVEGAVPLSPLHCSALISPVPPHPLLCFPLSCPLTFIGIPALVPFPAPNLPRSTTPPL